MTETCTLTRGRERRRRETMMRHAWRRLLTLSVVLVVPALAGCATLEGVTTGVNAGCLFGRLAGGWAGCMTGVAVGGLVGGVTGAAVDLTRVVATASRQPDRPASPPEPEQATPPADLAAAP